MTAIGRDSMLARLQFDDKPGACVSGSIVESDSIDTIGRARDANPERVTQAASDPAFCVTDASRLMEAT
jgi:hypothetical protein